MLRYAVLWKQFRDYDFTHPEMMDVLDDDRNLCSVTLNTFKRLGWLSVTLDPSDARKRTYRLIGPDKAVEGMLP
jgi:hypothetical protein